MSAKAIRESTGKDIINRHLVGEHGAAKCRFAYVDESTKWDQLIADNPWLETAVSFLSLSLYLDDFQFGTKHCSSLSPTTSSEICYEKKNNK